MVSLSETHHGADGEDFSSLFFIYPGSLSTWLFLYVLYVPPIKVCNHTLPYVFYSPPGPHETSYCERKLVYLQLAYYSN